MRLPPLDTGNSACRIWGQEARASSTNLEQNDFYSHPNSYCYRVQSNFANSYIYSSERWQDLRRSTMPLQQSCLCRVDPLPLVRNRWLVATTRPARAAPNLAIHPAPRAMTNITAASTKAEIIDASMELIETQAERITALQERQLILWCLLGIMSILLLAGAH